MHSRVYFFRDSQSPGDLHYEEIDQATGKIIAAGETPYHGEFSFQGPISVTPDGSQVILGTGAIFNESDLRISGGTWANVDVKWKDDLMVLLDNNDEVHIIEADTLDEYGSYAYTGSPRHLALGTTDAWLVQEIVTYHTNPAKADSDGDGLDDRVEVITHTTDPNDPDTDNDDYTDPTKCSTAAIRRTPRCCRCR